MARKASTPAPAFVAADYNAIVLAAIKACNAVDKATANSASAVQAWALASASAVTHKHKTLEDVKAALIASTPLATRKANVAATGRDISVEGIEACGSTIKGHWYAFNRIAKGDALSRLLKGEAFTTVARSVGKVQEQKGKGGARKASAATGEEKATDVTPIPIPSVALGDMSEAMLALAKRIDSAKASTFLNTETAKALIALAKSVANATARAETAAKVAKEGRKPRVRKAA